MHTPQEILDTIRSLTSLDISGVVERAEGDQESYSVYVEDGVFVCGQIEGRWIIHFTDRYDESSQRIWSEVETQEVWNAARLIDHVIEGGGKSVNPVLQKQFIEGIHQGSPTRNTFTTDIGQIVVHTRKHPVGTEVVIEQVDTGQLLRVLWEADRGVVDMSRAQRLDRMPF